jgi:AAA+ superfamily predicted ATPase
MRITRGKKATNSDNSLHSESLSLPPSPVWDDDEDNSNNHFLPAIDSLCNLFGLSKFERYIIILCAAVELNSDISQLCAKAQGNSNNIYPTFSLALTALPDGHWSALAPTSSLRHFKFIDIYGFPQVPLTKCHLQIEESILHYLTGIPYLDKYLQSMLEPLHIHDPIVDSQKEVADIILHAWQQNTNRSIWSSSFSSSSSPPSLSHIQLWGNDEYSKMVVASWVCRQLGLRLWHLPGDLVPLKTEDIESFIQIWSRDALLLGASLYVSTADIIEPLTQKFIKRLLANIPTPLFLSTLEPWSSSFAPNSFMLSLEIKKPTKSEQHKIWKSLLKSIIYQQKQQQHQQENDINKLDSEISNVVNQFDLNISSIQSAVKEVMFSMKRDKKLLLHSAIWESSLRIARPKLAELAQQIIPKARMDDLVLSEREKRLLRSIIMHVKYKDKVYYQWGFSSTSDRGLGITALFSGNSGTGKTMAAEVIANELKLDLFKIDLSMVISKYIGETEKNLRKIFEAAEDGGAILLFDEADTLFGKRSEIRDSHDRYANIEVGYLLQRMEAYKGLAILTTNMKDALDTSFLRRIRFVVNFPLPDIKKREEIWSRIFPPSVPVDGLDFGRLAQLEITGGHIQNIALNASFMAAADGICVNTKHIRQAAQEEYDKMGRPLPNIKLDK